MTLQCFPVNAAAQHQLAYGQFFGTQQLFQELPVFYGVAHGIQTGLPGPLLSRCLVGNIGKADTEGGHHGTKLRDLLLCGFQILGLAVHIGGICQLVQHRAVFFICFVQGDEIPVAVFFALRIREPAADQQGGVG